MATEIAIFASFCQRISEWEFFYCQILNYQQDVGAMSYRWIAAQLERIGKTQAALARETGIDPSAISKMIAGKRALQTDEIAAVAESLQVSSEALLRGLRDADAAGGDAAAPALSGAAPIGGSGARQPDMIPIRSGGRSGQDQEMFLEDGPVGHTLRPPSLTGVKGAYAIYNMGDSMSPRYEAGWLLHVNPFKPPAPGRDVVVLKRNNAVLIKQLVRRAKGRIVLRSYNRDYKDVEIDEKDVVSVHLIVGADQEGG
jgi:phage repressor protein C with HTH and peptisase S24 domain